MNNTNNITITVANLRNGRKQLAAELTKFKATPKEITSTQLLMEELFFRLKKGMKGDDNFSVDVTLRRIFGETSIRLKAEGIEYNPIPDVTEIEEDDGEEEAYRLAILKANSQKLSATYKNGANIVTIKVRGLDSTKKQLLYTVIALVLGVTCGLSMQMFLDGSTISTVNESFIKPVLGLFLNALHMMMAPVTFFAIISGITSMSDTALIGKIGGKLIFLAVFIQIFVSLFTLGLGTFLFTGDLSYIQAGITTSADSVKVQNVSIADMLLNIIPKNLVDPFKGDNILQVMFLAIFFGIIINKMGEKSKSAVECIDFIFRFVIDVLKIIVKAIPLVVFLSMTSLLSSTGNEVLIALSRLFGGLFLGIFVVFAVVSITIIVFAKISPFVAVKKIIGISPFLFMVSSPHARMPFVLKFCAEKLGIDGKLSAFTIPIGVQLNKEGSSVFFAMITLMLMRVYEIDVTLSVFITLWISVCIMAIAKPPIPCGGVICIAYLFSVVGVPPAALSIVLCVQPIATMFNGVCNEIGNITTSFIVAKNADMINEEKYFSNN